MIRVYRPFEALVLPGSLYGILLGYIGPVLSPAFHWGHGVRMSAPVLRNMENSKKDQATSAWRKAMFEEYEGNVIVSCGSSCDIEEDEVSLPLSRPEARYQAARWLAKHEAPLWWALSPGPCVLPEWVSAAVLHASVLRMAGHESTIREVWRRVPQSYPQVADIAADASNETPRWLKLAPGHDDGLRTFATVAQMIEAGRAVLDNDTLTVEVPDDG